MDPEGHTGRKSCGRRVPTRLPRRPLAWMRDGTQITVPFMVPQSLWDHELFKGTVSHLVAFMTGRAAQRVSVALHKAVAYELLGAVGPGECTGERR